jgi:hypothetical protein
MSAASNYLELEVLDHVLGEGARNFTSPAALHVALFTGTAGTVLTALESGTNSTSGTGNWGYYEATTSGTAYARQTVNFATAASGSSASNSTVTFPVATANYDSTTGSLGATVTCIAVVDAATSGNVLFFGQLTTSKTVSSGDQFTVSSGNLTVSLA